jgi:hypothetical protein
MESMIEQNYFISLSGVRCRLLTIYSLWCLIKLISVRGDGSYDSAVKGAPSRPDAGSALRIPPGRRWLREIATRLDFLHSLTVYSRKAGLMRLAIPLGGSLNRGCCLSN